MDDFLNKYISGCETILLPYGFKRKNKVFFRLVNDVIQSICIEKLGRYSYGRECRVEFSVNPLCKRIESKELLEGLGGYYLREFEISNCLASDRWMYKDTSEDISACVNEIFIYISKYLIPFFERVNNCKDALCEVIALEKLFYYNHIERTKLKGIKFIAGYSMEVVIFDSIKYFMALKSGDYDFALESRKALLEQNVWAYESSKNTLPEDVKIKREKGIINLQNEIQRLEEKDWDYFEKLVADNESYSMESLKDII